MHASFWTNIGLFVTPTGCLTFSSFVEEMIQLIHRCWIFSLAALEHHISIFKLNIDFWVNCPFNPQVHDVLKVSVISD